MVRAVTDHGAKAIECLERARAAGLKLIGLLDAEWSALPQGRNAALRAEIEAHREARQTAERHGERYRYALLVYLDRDGIDLSAGS